jgi:ribosomal protein S16
MFSRQPGQPRQVGETGEFDTIQAAHDDLPESGGRIEYLGSYDPTNEQFPIELWKPHTLVGDNTTRIENPDADTDTVVVRRESYTRPTFYWRDVYVSGGAVGVRLNDSRGRIDGGIVEDFGEYGVMLDTGDGSVSPNTIQIAETEICTGAGTGVYLTDKSHAVDFISVRIHKCGGRGVATSPDSTLASVNFRAGVIQRNDGYGIHAENDLNIVVHGMYFEGNGEAERHTGEIHLQDTDTALVENCYGNGGVDYQADYFVTLDGADHTTVRGLRANNYDEALVRAEGGTTELDVHRSTHGLAGVPRVIHDPNDQGLHTLRNGGVIGPRDLAARDADGTPLNAPDTDQELGLHDGRSGGPAGLYRWDRENRAWISVEAEARIQLDESA